MAFGLLSREPSGTCLEAKPILLPLKHIDIASKPRKDRFVRNAIICALARSRARVRVCACVGVCVCVSA